MTTFLMECRIHRLQLCLLLPLARRLQSITTGSTDAAALPTAPSQATITSIVTAPTVREVETASERGADQAEETEIEKETLMTSTAVILDWTSNLLLLLHQLHSLDIQRVTEKEISTSLLLQEEEKHHLRQSLRLSQEQRGLVRPTLQRSTTRAWSR